MAGDKYLKSDHIVAQEKGQKIENHPSNFFTRWFKNPTEDPGPVPDGGVLACMQVLAVHIFTFNTWGYVNSYGVFQEYYVEALNRSPSDVAWVGSIASCLTYAIGTFSGRATDAGFFKPTIILGSILVLVGVFMTSYSTQYWQIFLAQGLCQGIGNGLLFTPAMALLSTYFNKNRAWAIGIAACGNGTGGMVFPAIFQSLLPTIGFGWTVRVMGLVILTLQAIAVYTLRPRIPPRKSGPIVDWLAFKEMPYTLFAFAYFLVMWGVYLPQYYISSYFHYNLHSSQINSINILMILNGIGVAGRIVAAFFANKFTGPLNLLVIFNLVSALLMYSWIAIKTETGLYVFSGLYGFFGAGLLMLFPATLPNLTEDMQKMGVRTGMVFTIISIACLTGPPIAGVLIEKADGGYLYLQIFGGCTLMTGLLMSAGARVSDTGPKLKVKL
ncbi:MAG: hypothetical protein MMC33_010633 [Icmadophila ericetorum]|nr:hypothetical protein [Icmadophila ericetorum]